MGLCHNGLLDMGKKDLYLDLSLKNFKYQPHIMTGILYVAIPSSMNNLLYSALAIVINGMIALVAGSAAVGIYTVSMRIVQFAILPCHAIGVAVLTVAGVAYGAKNYENLKIALSYSLKISLAASVIFVIVIIFWLRRFHCCSHILRQVPIWLLKLHQHYQ